MYNDDYAGTETMRLHDLRTDLVRWFENYRIDRHAYPPLLTEWLTVEEEVWHVRGRRVVRYVGMIGADHYPFRRRVLFETGAPPPPTFMLPARARYEPPPPMPPGYAERMARNLQAYDMLRRVVLSRLFTPQQRFVAEVLPPVAPPPPRHRRNA